MPVLVVGVENAVPIIIFVMDVQDTVIVVILIVNVVPAQTFPQLREMISGFVSSQLLKHDS